MIPSRPTIAQKLNEVRRETEASDRPVSNSKPSKVAPGGGGALESLRSRSVGAESGANSPVAWSAIGGGAVAAGSAVPERPVSHRGGTQTAASSTSQEKAKKVTGRPEVGPTRRPVAAAQVSSPVMGEDVPSALASPPVPKPPAGKGSLLSPPAPAGESKYSSVEKATANGQWLEELRRIHERLGSAAGEANDLLVSADEQLRLEEELRGRIATSYNSSHVESRLKALVPKIAKTLRSAQEALLALAHEKLNHLKFAFDKLRRAMTDSTDAKGRRLTDAVQQAIDEASNKKEFAMADAKALPPFTAYIEALMTVQRAVETMGLYVREAYAAKVAEATKIVNTAASNISMLRAKISSRAGADGLKSVEQALNDADNVIAAARGKAAAMEADPTDPDLCIAYLDSSNECTGAVKSAQLAVLKYQAALAIKEMNESQVAIGAITTRRAQTEQLVKRFRVLTDPAVIRAITTVDSATTMYQTSIGDAQSALAAVQSAARAHTEQPSSTSTIKELLTVAKTLVDSLNTAMRRSMIVETAVHSLVVAVLTCMNSESERLQARVAHAGTTSRVSGTLEATAGAISAAQTALASYKSMPGAIAGAGADMGLVGEGPELQRARDSFAKLTESVVSAINVAADAVRSLELSQATQVVAEARALYDKLQRQNEADRNPQDEATEHLRAAGAAVRAAEAAQAAATAAAAPPEALAKFVAAADATKAALHQADQALEFRSDEKLNAALNAASATLVSLRATHEQLGFYARSLTGPEFTSVSLDSAMECIRQAETLQHQVMGMVKGPEKAHRSRQYLELLPKIEQYLATAESDARSAVKGKAAAGLESCRDAIVTWERENTAAGAPADPASDALLQAKARLAEAVAAQSALAGQAATLELVRAFSVATTRVQEALNVVTITFTTRRRKELSKDIAATKTKLETLLAQLDQVSFVNRVSNDSEEVSELSAALTSARSVNSAWETLSGYAEENDARIDLARSFMTSVSQLEGSIAAADRVVTRCTKNKSEDSAERLKRSLTALQQANTADGSPDDAASRSIQLATEALMAADAARKRVAANPSAKEVVEEMVAKVAAADPLISAAEAALKQRHKNNLGASSRDAESKFQELHAMLDALFARRRMAGSDAPTKSLHAAEQVVSQIEQARNVIRTSSDDQEKQDAQKMLISLMPELSALVDAATAELNAADQAVVSTAAAQLPGLQAQLRVLQQRNQVLGKPNQEAVTLTARAAVDVETAVATHQELVTHGHAGDTSGAIRLQTQVAAAENTVSAAGRAVLQRDAEHFRLRFQAAAASKAKLQAMEVRSTELPSPSVNALSHRTVELVTEMQDKRAAEAARMADAIQAVAAADSALESIPAEFLHELMNPELAVSRISIAHYKPASADEAAELAGGAHDAVESASTACAALDAALKRLADEVLLVTRGYKEQAETLVVRESRTRADVLDAGDIAATGDVVQSAKATVDRLQAALRAFQAHSDPRKVVFELLDVAGSAQDTLESATTSLDRRDAAILEAKKNKVGKAVIQAADEFAALCKALQRLQEKNSITSGPPDDVTNLIDKATNMFAQVNELRRSVMGADDASGKQLSNAQLFVSRVPECRELVKVATEAMTRRDTSRRVGAFETATNVLKVTKSQLESLLAKFEPLRALARETRAMRSSGRSPAETDVDGSGSDAAQTAIRLAKQAITDAEAVHTRLTSSGSGAASEDNNGLVTALARLSREAALAINSAAEAVQEYAAGIISDLTDMLRAIQRDLLEAKSRTQDWEDGSGSDLRSQLASAGEAVDKADAALTHIVQLDEVGDWEQVMSEAPDFGRMVIDAGNLVGTVHSAIASREAKVSAALGQAERVLEQMHKDLARVKQRRADVAGGTLGCPVGVRSSPGLDQFAHAQDSFNGAVAVWQELQSAAQSRSRDGPATATLERRFTRAVPQAAQDLQLAAKTLSVEVKLLASISTAFQEFAVLDGTLIRMVKMYESRGGLREVRAVRSAVERAVEAGVDVSTVRRCLLQGVDPAEAAARKAEVRMDLPEEKTAEGSVLLAKLPSLEAVQVFIELLQAAKPVVEKANVVVLKQVRGNDITTQAMLQERQKAEVLLRKTAAQLQELKTQLQRQTRAQAGGGAAAIFSAATANVVADNAVNRALTAIRSAMDMLVTFDASPVPTIQDLLDLSASVADSKVLADFAHEFANASATAAADKLRHQTRAARVLGRARALIVDASQQLSECAVVASKLEQHAAFTLSPSECATSVTALGEVVQAARKLFTAAKARFQASADLAKQAETKENIAELEAVLIDAARAGVMTSICVRMTATVKAHFNGIVNAGA